MSPQKMSFTTDTSCKFKELSVTPSRKNNSLEGFTEHTGRSYNHGHSLLQLKATDFKKSQGNKCIAQNSGSFKSVTSRGLLVKSIDKCYCPNVNK